MRISNQFGSVAPVKHLLNFYFSPIRQATITTERIGSTTSFPLNYILLSALSTVLVGVTSFVSTPITFVQINLGANYFREQAISPVIFWTKLPIEITAIQSPVDSIKPRKKVRLLAFPLRKQHVMAASIFCCCSDLKDDEHENGAPRVIFEIPLVATDKYLESERLPRNVGIISDAHDPDEILRCPNEFRSLWISFRSSQILCEKLARLGRMPNLTHWRFDALLSQSESDDLSNSFATHFRAHKHTLRSVEVVYPSYVSGPYYPEDVYLPALEDLARNLPILENLDRLIFRVPDLPQSLYQNGLKFGQVRYLHLQSGPIASDMNIDAPSLEVLNFDEECSIRLGPSSLDLSSSTRLRKLEIHSFRRIVLNGNNQHLQHVSMTHVPTVEGRFGNLSVLELFSCGDVPEIVGLCGRNLRELNIVGFEGRPDERHRRVVVDSVKVLRLRSITGLMLVSSACLEVLCIQDVEFVDQQPSFSAIRLHLMSTSNYPTIADMKANIDLSAVTHLAIQASVERVFCWESMVEELKDNLVFFATDVQLGSELPQLRNVQYLGLSGAQDFKFLLPSIYCPNRVPLREIAILRFSPAIVPTTIKMLQEVFCENLSLPSPAPINWVHQFFNRNIGVRSNLIGPGKIDRIH